MLAGTLLALGTLVLGKKTNLNLKLTIFLLEVFLELITWNC